MRLIGHRTIRGRIRLLTGLHIGATPGNVEIGGMDNPVIRDALDGLPYIPGSSLKGKIRSLLEWREDKSNNGEPCKCASTDCLVCRVFGIPGSDGRGESSAQTKALGPTRVLFRDALLTEESRERLEELRREKGLLYVEEKYENAIDRLTGTAKHPRPVERIPPGVEFGFEVALRVFEGDEEEKMLDFLREGLRLLERDALGGLGSRGYGKVEFVDCRDDRGRDFMGGEATG